MARIQNLPNLQNIICAAGEGSEMCIRDSPDTGANDVIGLAVAGAVVAAAAGFVALKKK